MAVNHQHLRAFHAIASEGGFSRAARRLNVSQPTLSQQLKALEARYGVTLFENRKVPLKLTTAGTDLFALTRRLFATAADIDEMLGETSGLNGGLLRLGADNPTYAAAVVARFRADHPGTHVQLRMGNAREVMRWLAEAQIDAALASDPAADPAFSYTHFAEDGLSCAVPVGHPLLAESEVPIAALAHETLIVREPTSKTRAFLERALGRAGVQPMTILEMQGRETIREAIALGLGISVFFDSECPPDPRLGYRPLEAGERPDRLRSFFVCQSERRRSALMKAVRQATEAIAPRVGEHGTDAAHVCCRSDEVPPRRQRGGR